MHDVCAATGGNPGVGGTIPGSIKVGGVTLNSGGVVYAKTDTDGNVITEGADEENYNIMWNGLNLTLNNAKIVHTDGCAIDAEGDLSITLEGNNTVSASDTGDEYEHFDKGLAAIHSTGDITINDGGGKGIGSIDASVVNTVGNHADGIRAAGDINLDNVEVTAEGAKNLENSSTPDYSNGICSDSGDIDIYDNANVTAKSGFGKTSVAGINAANGNVTIRGNATVVASVSMRTAPMNKGDGTKVDGIRANGDVDINGGDIHADGAVSDEITYEPATNAAVLNLNNGSNGKSNKMRPEFSQGIFSEAGNVNISGAETEVEACGGYAIKSNVAIGTAAGNILMNGGNVRAHGLEDEGAAYGVNAMKNTDGKGGDIIITGGVFSAAGNNGGISCAGDLKASPAAKHAIEMKTGDTIKYTNDVDIFEGHKAVDYKATYAAAKAIKGSPFKAETVVERNLVAEKQYFDSRVVKADAPAGGEQTDANKPGPKTGDDSNMALWAGILVLAAAGAAGAAIYGRRKKLN